MCGIAGIVGKAVDDAAVQKILTTMKRRGPDDNGIFRDRNCCLIHSRLAIIDIDGGKQPMHFSWGGETYTIVYNGELYNTQELRLLLLRLGHVFTGHSDTEVLLHAYAQWSEGCLDRINGIFAFAVWEHKRKKLFLARDRIGVKPLFFMKQGKSIIFGSEIKNILTFPEVNAQLDAEGVVELLMLGPGRAPGSGVLKDVQELEPGCYGYFICGKWNWKRYWKLTDREHRESFEETAEHVRYLVTDAIKRQMISDVPIGTFLSGGLDSSIITAVCADQLRSKGVVLKTFSVDYENNDKYFKPEKFQPNSDNSFIEIMQEFLKTKHYWTKLNAKELSDGLKDATYARDLPGMADVDISLLLFCKRIRREVKVALSGECADEIFGGYPWYRDPEIRATNGFPWSQNISERAGLLSSGVLKNVNPVDFANDQYNRTIQAADILPECSHEERRIKEMVNLNHRWFMQTLLDRKDRMSMYNGLEVRVPFCDHRIAEYMYAVPWEYKDYMGREKGLLRYAMSELLPEEVRSRKKSPYPKTYDPAYLRLMTEQMDLLLKKKDAPIFYIIDKNTVSNLLNNDSVWPWYGQLMRRPQTIAYFLQMNHWLESYNISFCF